MKIGCAYWFAHLTSKWYKISQDFRKRPHLVKLLLLSLKVSSSCEQLACLVWFCICLSSCLPSTLAPAIRSRRGRGRILLLVSVKPADKVRKES